AELGRRRPLLRRARLAAAVATGGRPPVLLRLLAPRHQVDCQQVTATSSPCGWRRWLALRPEVWRRREVRVPAPASPAGLVSEESESGHGAIRE
ncbi:unnamed protein product, partial [Prorocentrum cordatum]